MSFASRVESVFRSSLGVDEDLDLETISYRSIPEWDSVAHMALVTALEDAFDVLFETDDILGMSNFAIAVQTVERLKSS